MIQKFYSSISNGNRVDKCNHTTHYKPDIPYLIKTNYLSEFRSELEKAKVRANLGIADALTLYWGNIQGSVEESVELSSYIKDLVNGLLSFTSSLFPEIKNVRDASLKSLEYLSTFEGEKESIDLLNTYIELILYKLYGVNSLQDVDQSTGGILNKFLEDITNLQDYILDNDTNIDNLIEKTTSIESDIDEINEVLLNINNQINISKDPTNAIKENHTWSENIDGLEVSHTDGLYVKDLSELVNQNTSDISGIDTALDVLLLKVNQFNSTFVSRDELGGSDFNFAKKSDLNNYVEKDSEASLLKLIVPEIRNSEPIKTTGLVNESGPLDYREIVNNTISLLNLNKDICYKGMKVVVLNELPNPPKMYILMDNEHPEDISSWVTSSELPYEVITKEIYDARKELKVGETVTIDEITYYPLNSNYFYYIIEEDLLEPVRTSYPEGDEGTEAYNIAHREWELSLGLMYVSARWANEIETALSRKASVSELVNLSSRVDNLDSAIGGSGSESISVQINEINNKINTINNTSLPDLTQSDLNLDLKIENIKDAIGDVPDNKTITELINDINTNLGSSGSIGTDILDIKDLLENDVVLKNSNTSLNSLDLTSLKITNSQVTVEDSTIIDLKDIHKAQTLTQEAYDALSTEEKNNGTYYYVTLDMNTPNDERYITQADLNNFENTVYKKSEVYTQEQVDNIVATAILSALDNIFSYDSVTNTLVVTYDNKEFKINPVDLEP